jgi:hypothetical protein
VQNLRTSIFGAVFGLALAAGIGFGATQLHASFATPASVSADDCDVSACPMEATAACPMDGAKAAAASVDKASCPTDGATTAQASTSVDKAACPTEAAKTADAAACPVSKDASI